MPRNREVETEALGRAEVELVPARILTPAGWIVGKLHVQADSRIVDFLDRTPEFFSLVDVILEGRPKVVPLFTLQRSAILFLIAETENSLESDRKPRQLVEHPISCLLENGMLYGRVKIITGVRLSEYLSRHKGFVLVRDCHFRLRNPWEDRIIDHREPAVLLNPEAVIGVSEAARDE